MLSHIEGIVQPVDQNEVLVQVGAFGLSFSVPNSAAFEPGKSAKIFAYMHWNAENGPSLFGFATALDKTIFQLVISCSGLGPKIALAVLSDLGPQLFLEAISKGDEAALSQVSGIGAKKAEQMIVQLKHKVAKLLKSGIEIQASSALHDWNNMSQVLESLSYSRPEINAALGYVQENAQPNASFDQLMRQALSFLAKGSSSVKRA